MTLVTAVIKNIGLKIHNNNHSLHWITSNNKANMRNKWITIDGKTWKQQLVETRQQIESKETVS